MLTPLDIQNKEFKKTLRGYEVKAVENFLDEVMEDYEKIYKENIELKDKVNLFSDQIRHYNTLEETLKNTLIIAQTTSEEVISSARTKSQNITDEAEITGDRIIALANEKVRDIKQEANDKVRDIKQEYEHLRKEMFYFKTSYQSFIEAQLISLEKFHKEIEEKNIEISTEEEIDEIIDEDLIYDESIDNEIRQEEMSPEVVPSLNGN
nr:DivIVA domain-containing protein [Tissierella sp.]